VPTKVDRLILKKKIRKIVARLPHLSLALHLEAARQETLRERLDYASMPFDNRI
jgi:hypothetical protein